MPGRRCGRRSRQPHVRRSCGPGRLLSLAVRTEVVADDNLAPWRRLGAAHGKPKETIPDAKNKRVSRLLSSQPCARRECPTGQARLQPAHDSPHVALAAVCRADVVPQNLAFLSADRTCSPAQPSRRGPRSSAGAGSGFPHTWSRPGRIPARGGERPGAPWGAAVAGWDMPRPLAPLWLGHAAPAPPRGPHGADTAVTPAGGSCLRGPGTEQPPGPTAASPCPPPRAGRGRERGHSCRCLWWSQARSYWRGNCSGDALAALRHGKSFRATKSCRRVV